MSERLSFYVKRESVLHRFNPLTKITIVLALILISFFNAWYWIPHILIFAAIIPLSFLGKVPREYFLAAARLIIPATTFLFLMQSVFQPIGEEIIIQFWVLDVTRESLLFALLNATRIFVMVSSFTLFMLTTHPSDLMTELTSRGLPPQFAYVIISTLQILPQMQTKAQTINAAQRSRGLDTEGTFVKRLGALLPLISPLIFGSLVEVEERAIAIEARGFTSTRAKTSLHEIPDSNFDKILRWGLALLVIASIVSRIWLS